MFIFEVLAVSPPAYIVLFEAERLTLGCEFLTSLYFEEIVPASNATE